VVHDHLDHLVGLYFQHILQNLVLLGYLDNLEDLYILEDL